MLYIAHIAGAYCTTLSFLPHCYNFCFIKATSINLHSFQSESLNLKFTDALGSVDEANHG